jgi:hypothetical protein
VNVLIACERSGIVREAFKTKGHNAWSCDTAPTEIEGQHYQMNIIDVLRWGNIKWDLMIAHPPCTRLCNSGVMWLERRNLWPELDEGAKLFTDLLNAHIPHIAVENPIPHKYALVRIGRKYDQIIQPWQFGHGETKATCLWLKNLPPLTPTNLVEGREQRLHRLPPSPSRAMERSRTFQGIANAMADQWGKL